MSVLEAIDFLTLIHKRVDYPKTVDMILLRTEEGFSQRWDKMQMRKFIELAKRGYK